MSDSKAKNSTRLIGLNGDFLERSYSPKLGLAHDWMQYLKKSLAFANKHNSKYHLWTNFSIRNIKPASPALLHIYQRPKTGSEHYKIKIHTTVWGLHQKTNQVCGFIPRSQFEGNHITCASKYLWGWS